MPLLDSAATETAPIEGLSRESQFGLVIVSDDEPRFLRLSSGVYEIGRDEEAAIRIPDSAASRNHAKVVVGDGVTVEDLGSKNGTLVEGRRLSPGQPIALRVGAAIEVGATALILQRTSCTNALTRPTQMPPATPATSPWLALADRIASDDVSVVVLGETGVGKEVLASRIHAGSRRASGPFIRVHPAAISPALFESELFGHERGSFTGAIRDHIGLVERADGGTLFIDEIGELPLDGQVKLLRLLEDRVVRRVGARTERTIDVRFIAATNRDLEAEVARGSFRADLYFRLAGVVLRVPPLRDRRREIEPSAREFLAGWCAARDVPVPEVDAAIWDELAQYPWPGNLRELRTVVEHAALVSDGRRIRPEDLPRREMDRRASSVPAPSPLLAEAAALSGSDSDEDPRRARIRSALERSAGNQTEAAKLLGVTRRTLSNWMNELRLPRPRKGVGP